MRFFSCIILASMILCARANRPKFTGFVQPNIVTSLPPAGGSGVHGRFIPVYDKELHKLSKYIESPFDAPKMERTAERQSHEKVLENLHDSKRFSGRVKKKDHFTKSVEVYGLGENADGTTIIMPTYKDKEKKSPLRDKDGQLMAPWYPSEPGKKVGVHAHVRTSASCMCGVSVYALVYMDRKTFVYASTMIHFCFRGDFYFNHAADYICRCRREYA